MARELFTWSCLLSLLLQANSQMIRSPLAFLSPNPYSETIIELPGNMEFPTNFIDVPYVEPPRFIEPPRNFIQPQPIIAEQPLIPLNNIPSPTTVITDCSPSVCKNLADTINLMVISNLLQNTLGELKSLKMTAALLKNVVANPALASYPGLISGLVNPNLIAPNIVAPNPVAPRIVAPTPIVAPNAVAPNVPVNNSAMLSSLLKMLGSAI